MNYVIKKGSELYEKLIAIQKRAKDARDKALQLAKDFGGKEAYTNGRHFSGGLDAVEFDTPPEGWRSVGKKWLKLYYPKSVNKEALSKIADLPVVEIDEVNAILSFQGGQVVSAGDGLAFVKMPHVYFRKDCILIKVTSGVKYKPVQGMEEILESEFQKLMPKEK